MRFHPDNEIDARIRRLIGSFCEDLRPFTLDRSPTMTVAEIVAEIRLFYGARAAGAVTITVH
ncbi:hypothetical protein AB7645_05480 [Bradyrhizobium sp. 956_D2_N1_5]|uniref:hypothetical protein n=1 Tax=unclassified Bradyrhizobium TaxID=2631580 RepID=UPI003F28C091